jgi:hypothetical protein
MTISGEGVGFWNFNGYYMFLFLLPPHTMAPDGE